MLNPFLPALVFNSTLNAFLSALLLALIHCDPKEEP
jgi:hypothetical protein